MGSILLNLA